MFEMPEYIAMAKDMEGTIVGKSVARGELGNSPHKFVWYNRKPEEFSALVRGKKVGRPIVRGRWLSLPLEPGFVLLLGECGGTVLFHDKGSERPAKRHLLIEFGDGTALSACTRMWGAYELHEAGKELERPYVKDMRPTPLSPGFTKEYFRKLVAGLTAEGKRSAKSLLTQEQLIPGLGNSIAQDILFLAKIHPKRDISTLSPSEIDMLHGLIESTVRKAADLGGRNDETGLFGKAGGYERLMHAGTKQCPACGSLIEKLQYLGGSCYVCARCQKR